MTLKENLKSLADNHHKNLKYKRLREKCYVTDKIIESLKSSFFERAAEGDYHITYLLLQIINEKYEEDVQKIRTKVRDEICHGVVDYLSAELAGVKISLYRNDKVDYIEFSWS